ncbi:MAG: phospho-N-acetylmuramoyl-pentapeptide-transferase [Lachnospiraceae bacterium]|nr:phospho-N-acetylmuramoyl-pentapeptide-transferase [Lachnospiraceae bacterium]
MFDLLTEISYLRFSHLSGLVLSFALTIILMKALASKMPHDQGRAFAVDGTLSKGKVRGVGIIFVLVFAICSIIFDFLDLERLIYTLVIVATMLTGFFDDASEKPWNEYLKGALDLMLGAAVAVTYLYYNGNCFYVAFPWNITITIPYVPAAILIMALVWMSINVTNCTDGVDGLSASLCIITLLSFMIFGIIGAYDMNTYFILYFIVVLVAYLWYNANPSTMLMGDAGSRAMGMMIAVTALICGYPLLYIPFAAVMIFDGGLGLVKVALLRFFKIKILVNTRCPLHDQARKVKEWSNTQVVFRFCVIQSMINIILLAFMFSVG